MGHPDNAPRWDGSRGRYEVWFLTMSTGEGGFWIRYALRAPVAGPPEPELWFARFDRRDPGRTFGIHAALPPEAFRPEGSDIHIGEAVLESGRATGAVTGGGHDVRWDVAFDGEGPTVRLLPGPLYAPYAGGLATTRVWTPGADLRYEGSVVVDGERLVLGDAPGQQGHVYGTRHAERWAWAFASGGDGSAVQAVCARARRGPVRTPYLTFATVRAGGRWVRVSGASGEPPWGLGWWRLALRSLRYRLEGTVRAEPEHLLRARYLDPDDTPRWCHHSDVASARLVLWERTAGAWREVAEVAANAQAEWAGRTPAPQVAAEHREAG